MKQFFKWIGKHIAGALVFSLFSLLFIAGIVYALTYPSAPPVGEVVGGKFMQYFNSIKVACPDGYYLNGYDVNYNKVCAVAPTGAQGPAGVSGPQGPVGTTGPQGPAGANVSGTWHDVTASRVNNTVYTNTTGKDIFVVVDEHYGSYVNANPWSPSLVGAGYAVAYVNTTIVGRVGGNGDADAADHFATLPFFVPNGSTYKITGTALKNTWVEFY